MIDPGFGPVLVTGANGMLGSAFLRHAPTVMLGSARGTTGPLAFDIRDQEAVESAFEQVRPLGVIHCAAFASVDGCEADPTGARDANVMGSSNVASAAARCGAWMIYVSTDSVFDGSDGPYDESDPPRPINIYSVTKLEGEQRVRDLCPQHLIVRTNFYGYRDPNGKSLGEWLIRELSHGKTLGGFTNVHFNPLFVDQVVELTLDVWSSGRRGVVHLGSEGTCSKYQFARELAGRCGFDPSLVEPAFLDSKVLSAPRPRNTTLDIMSASRSLSRIMPSRESGLVEFARCVCSLTSQSSPG